MPHVSAAPARTTASPAPAGASPAAGASPQSIFWSAQLGSASGAIVALCPHIDVMSQRIGQLPVRAALTRPVVGQYLAMLKTLASAWSARNRPALAAALGSLVHFGDSLCQSFGLEALAGQRADGGRAALRVLDALLRRLNAPLAAFAALDTGFGSYLRQMARISAELDTDSALVTQRLQADVVHCFLLSQQGSTLQSKLDDAKTREQAWWLPGPHASALHQEICLHSSALAGVRRQLDQLRAEQAATQAEADYLQSLLPTLSTYLDCVDRMGEAITAALAGARALGAELEGLKQSLLHDPASGARAGLQLSAAMPHWQALAAQAARLAPVAAH